MSRDSMYRYQQFARSDAASLAAWLDAEFDVAEVRRVFGQLSLDHKLEFERRNAGVIQELIRKTEGQRPAFMRRCGKNADDMTKALVIVFAMLGLGRVKQLMAARDEFIMSIHPGSGYRVTCASVYGSEDSLIEMLSSLSDYEWPAQAFADFAGVDLWDDPEEDDLEEDEDS